MERSTALNSEVLKSRHALLYKWILWLLVALGVVIIALQIIEYEHGFARFDALFFIELILFTIPLSLIGVLLRLYQQVVTDKDRAIQILNIKHQLSLELSAARDMNELVDLVTRFLASFVTVKSVSLDWDNRETSQLEPLNEPNPDGEPQQKTIFPAPLDTCTQCSLNTSGQLTSLQSCSHPNRRSSQGPGHGYCLPLFYNHTRIAVLQFLLLPGASLTTDQAGVLNQIGEEITLAVVSARQRRSLLEMQANKAVVEERLSIFRDLHDTLGQALAYVCLKLSQLAQENDLSQASQARAELLHVSTVANEAYEQVREALASLRQEHQNELGNLLIERAKLVAERSEVKFEFSTAGPPRSLPPQVERQIVYIFREALSNIEKHACAQRVEVHMSWSENEFVLRIVDDGCGFDQDSVQKEGHYGLDIMKERVEEIEGRMILNSRPEEGTEIRLYVPIRATPPIAS